MTDHEKTLPLTKKIAASLLDHTILPFYQMLKQDAALAPLLEDEAVRHDMARHIAAFEAALINTPDQLSAQLVQLVEYLQSLKMAPESYKAHLTQLLALFDQWLDQAHLLEEEKVSQLHAQIKAAQAQLADIIASHTPAEEDDFVMAESVEVDAAINGMHTSGEGRAVIDAQTFLEQATDLDDEFIERISEHLQDLEVEIIKAHHLTPELLTRIRFYLEELSMGLDASIEFEDLGFSLMKLVSFLEGLELDSLEPDMNEVLKTLLEQLIADLSKWAYHIFEAKDAQDIHYLDAALFAAIRQIEILFEAQHATPTDEKQADEEDGGFITF